MEGQRHRQSSLRQAGTAGRRNPGANRRSAALRGLAAIFIGFDQDHGVRQGSYQDADYQNTEGVMEKRSTVHAVVAESLVFESSFGAAQGTATHSSQEAAKRAQSIPAWSAAALACETIKTNDPAA